MRTPPRLAMHALELFVRDEALIGDIAEEFAAGRSRGWVWSQTMAAVGGRLMRAWDIHNLFSVNGRVLQVLMMALVAYCAVFMVRMLDVLVFHGTLARAAEPALAGLWLMLQSGVAFAAALVIGHAVGRWHQGHRYLASLVFASSLAAWTVVSWWLLGAPGSGVMVQALAALAFVSGLVASSLRPPGQTHHA